jgi:hypothetical protein
MSAANKEYRMWRVLGLALTCIAGLACSAGESREAARGAEEAQADGGKQGIVELDGLKSKVPATWIAQKPAGNLRHAQYRVPHADMDSEDAELVVFYFNKGGGGTVDENVKRWKNNFSPGNDKEAKPESKLDTFKVGDVKVTLLDISGVYLANSAPNNPNAKIERKSNYRMFAVIFESPNGPYFIRMTGPQRTMAQQKQGFDDWLKNFK